MNTLTKLSQHPLMIKLFNWEYWPFNVLYGPVYLYWIWLCIKARSFFFFNTSNPTIKNGGFLMESKKEIYDLMPAEYYPKTLLMVAGSSEQQIREQLEKTEMAFPMIGKPDIGMRGLAVMKLTGFPELMAYARNSRVDFLLQEFVSFENEVGIFYYRFPDQANGHISGIVGKEFLTVVGNGVATVKELLQLDKRYLLQLKTLSETFGDQLDKVLPVNEKFLMVPYGNHSRGAKFIDISALADQELTHTIDKVCKQIPGFYFGRLDIRYHSWEDLKQGKNFSIIELNGAGSEPTHMYDPTHSIFFAWKEIIRHWQILLHISRMNHEFNEIPYLSFQEGIQMLKENGAYVKMIEPDKQAIA